MCVHQGSMQVVQQFWIHDRLTLLADCYKLRPPRISKVLRKNSV